MDIVDLFKTAREKQQQYASAFNGFIAPVKEFKVELEQMKNDMVPAPMRDIGFGNADMVSMPAFQPASTPDALSSMASTMSMGGIYNPAASMLQGPGPEAQPAPMASFIPQQDTYVDPMVRAAEEGQVQVPALLDEKEKKTKPTQPTTLAE